MSLSFPRINFFFSLAEAKTQPMEDETRRPPIRSRLFDDDIDPDKLHSIISENIRTVNVATNLALDKRKRAVLESVNDPQTFNKKAKKYLENLTMYRTSFITIMANTIKDSVNLHPFRMMNVSTESANGHGLTSFLYENLLAYEEFLVKQMNLYVTYVKRDRSVWIKMPSASSYHGLFDYPRYAYEKFTVEQFKDLMKLRELRVYYPDPKNKDMRDWISVFLQCETNETREETLFVKIPHGTKFLGNLRKRVQRKRKEHDEWEHSPADTRGPEPALVDLMAYTKEDLEAQIAWEIKVGSIGECWIESDFKATKEIAVYDISMTGNTETTLNTFQGLAMSEEYVAAHREEIKRDYKLLVPLLNHLFGVWFGFSKEAFAFFLQILAFSIQKRTRTNVSTWIVGEEGIGKTGVAETFIKTIVGEELYYSCTDVVNDMTGSFNDSYKGQLWWIFDETRFNTPTLKNWLKNFVTSSTITVRQKFLPSSVMPNNANTLAFTNDYMDLFLACGEQSRRFFVCKAVIEPMLELQGVSKLEYMKTLFCGEEGSAEQKEQIRKVSMILAHLLYSLDLTNFDPQKIPESPILWEQRIKTLKEEKPVLFWWLEIISTKRYKVEVDGPANLNGFSARKEVIEREFSDLSIALPLEEFREAYNYFVKTNTRKTKAHVPDNWEEGLNILESYLPPLDGITSRVGIITIQATNYRHTVINTGTIEQCRQTFESKMSGARWYWLSREDRLAFEPIVTSKEWSKETLAENYPKSSWFMFREGFLKTKPQANYALAVQGTTDTDLAQSVLNPNQYQHWFTSQDPQDADRYVYF